MWTTILAYLIAFMGVITVASGAWGFVFLMSQTGRIPLRYYAMMIGMVSGGLSMAGLAQALRLLLVLNDKG